MITLWYVNGSERVNTRNPIGTWTFSNSFWSKMAPFIVASVKVVQLWYRISSACRSENALIFSRGIWSVLVMGCGNYVEFCSGMSLIGWEVIVFRCWRAFYMKGFLCFFVTIFFYPFYSKIFVKILFFFKVWTLNFKIL